MNKYHAFLLSLSIIAPLLTGLIRYRNIPVSYHPVIYLLIIGFVNEIISYVFFYNTSNAIPTNTYFISEALLLVWQFRVWKNILRNNIIYKSLIILLTSVWAIENILLGNIVTFNPAFQVLYSMLLVLLAVNQLNWLVVNEKGSIIYNAKFIICIGIIIFFSYKILTEIFYYYSSTNAIKNNIFVIESYINVGYNVLLTIAMICIPQKSKYIRL